MMSQFMQVDETPKPGEYISLRLGGREFTCIDTAIKHDFNFTPSISMFIDFASSAKLQRVCDTLSQGGEQLMPPRDYGFSRLLGWTKDRYGASW